MGRVRGGRTAECRLCMKPTLRHKIATIDNLPKTFAHILEEMSGIKFSDAEGIKVTVCLQCKEFLHGMDNQSLYPGANKISGSGKKKVRRLMDEGYTLTEAMDKVIAEKRAREVLAEAGVINPPRAVQNKPRAVQLNAPRGRAGVGAQGPARKGPGSVNVDPDYFKKRLSGSQRRKRQILMSRGLNSNEARDLVLAASAQKLVQEIAPQKRRDDVVKRRDDVVKRRDDVVQRRDDVVKRRDDVVKRRDDVVKRRDDVVKPPRAKFDRRGILADSKNNDQPSVAANNVRRGGNVPPQAVGRPNRPNQYKYERQPISDNRGRFPEGQNFYNNIQQSQYGQDGGNRNQREQCPLEVGIVPQHFPNIRLDEKKLDALKEAITNEIVKIPPGAPPIRFLGTSAQNGWLKLVCADQMSYDWLARLVSRWERAGIRLVEGNLLPKSFILSCYLSGDFRSPDEILNIIERQNRALNAGQWRLVNRELDSNGQNITICVDEQSMKTLKHQDFMVFLGLGMIELKPRRFAGNDDFQGMYGNGMGNDIGSGNSFSRQDTDYGQNASRMGYQNQRVW